MSLRVSIKPYFEESWGGNSRKVLRVELRNGSPTEFDSTYLDVRSAFDHYHANGRSESVEILDYWLEKFETGELYQGVLNQSHGMIEVAPQLPRQSIYYVPSPSLNLLYIQPVPKIIILLLVTMKPSRSAKHPPGTTADAKLVTTLAKAIFTEAIKLQGLPLPQFVQQLQTLTLTL